MNGFLGRLLLVDLGSGKISQVPLDEAMVRQYVGGAGLACRLLFDRIDSSVDPLGPRNPLLFMAGPLVGTAAPLCGRYEVCARSPQTGLWGEANSGGRFGPLMRFAGFDGILFTGQSERPVYLWVWNGEAELRDAEGIWGLDSYKTQEAIRNVLRQENVSIACIGPAGENVVRYAAIMNDWGRAAGRTGMGAVMGAKRLKALVVGGEQKIPLADEPSLKAASGRIVEWIREDVKAQFLSAGGTGSATDMTMWLGDVPNRYFTKGVWEPTASLGGGTMAQTILTGTRACYRCAIGCGRVTSVPSRTAATIDGPEYETAMAFGSLMLNDDLPGVAYAGHLCNLYGIDTISAGSTIAFGYYLYDLGILTTSDTDGLELEWGSVEPVFTLIDKIAHREGFGSILAEGSRYLGRRFGVESWAVQVNGLEVPMHDPRAFVGMGLVYATSPRGACHNAGDMYLVDLGAPVPELGIELGERLESSAEKALMTSRIMDWRSLYNSLIMCVFCNPPASEVLALLNAATGWDVTLGDLLTLGARSLDLRRLMNGKLGLTAADDRLPDLLLKPLPDVEVETAVPDMERLLSAFYEVRGWDARSGMPSPARREILELPLF